MAGNSAHTPSILHLGSDYALAVSKNGTELNTIEFIKWPEPFSGKDSEILARIPGLSDTEVNDFLKKPTDYQRENTMLQIGTKEKEINRILLETVLSIEELTENKEIYSTILHSLELGGRHEAANDLKQQKLGLEANVDQKVRSSSESNQSRKSRPYTKEQVISLYTRYLTGDKLTYDERSQLVAYDQKNNSFEQMQMRLEGLEFARFTNPTLDLIEKEQQLMDSKGESKSMQTITSKEYYELSKNERTIEQSKPISVVHTMDRDPQQLQSITVKFMENQLEEIIRFLSAYETTKEINTLKIESSMVQVVEGDHGYLFSYNYYDGIAVYDQNTRNVHEVISKAFTYDSYPSLLEDMHAHMEEYLSEQQSIVLNQLADMYDIKTDPAFDSTDYEKIFHYPTLTDDRDILSGIHHQRSEKIVDWAFKGTYTAAEITKYKNSHILSLQRKLIEGHNFYQIDEHMELMMNASKETQGGYKGILFDETGDVDTFTVKDSKTAATKLFELGASPCSKSSLSFVKQFLADSQNQSTQQHLIHNRVMQETYREETGRSMTGRG